MRFEESSLIYRNLKYQITNIKQFPMTKIQKSKQSLALEGIGH